MIGASKNLFAGKSIPNSDLPFGPYREEETAVGGESHKVLGKKRVLVRAVGFSIGDCRTDQMRFGVFLPIPQPNPLPVDGGHALAVGRQCQSVIYRTLKRGSLK